MNSLKQKLSFVFWLFAAVVVLVILSWQWRNRPGLQKARDGQASAPAEPYRYPMDRGLLAFATSANADENLFALNLLEGLHDSFPMGSFDEAELTSYNQRVETHLKHLRASKVDREIVNRYEDIKTGFDAYVRCLVNLGQIEKQVERTSGNDTGELLSKSFATGASVGGFGHELGFSTTDAAIGAIAAGGIHFLWKKLEASNRNQELKNQAVQEETRSLQLTLEGINDRTIATAKSLTEKLGWRKGEAGFDVSPQESELFQKAVANKDDALIAQIYSNQLRLRPRDPILHLKAVAYQSAANQRKRAEDFYKAAERALAAYSLVPVGEFYDQHRIMVLSVAVMFWNAGMDAEAGTGGFTLGARGNAEVALLLLEKLLSLDPKDSDGAIRQYASWANAHRGELNHAWTLANEVFQLRKDDPEFQAKYARILVLNKRGDEAIPYLESALRMGYGEVRQLRTSADFKHLTAGARTKLDDLLKVKFTWEIKWGFLNDDVLLRNDSVFPITGVVLQPKIEAAGKRFNPELKHAYVKPGETIKWTDAFSIPGSKYDRANAVLICDQN